VSDAPAVASLPMYDWPEIAWANDALWSAIAKRLIVRGIAAPPLLDRESGSDAVWDDRRLVLSQTCGYPFSTRLKRTVRYVGTPVYDAPGCQGSGYSSVIVVRSDEGGERLGDIDPSRFAYNAADSLSGEGGERLGDIDPSRFAYNAADSLSGYLALANAASEAGIDPRSVEWLETGSHRASLRLVAAGNADVAAIDAVCWSLALRFEPAAGRLKVIEQTAFRPGLPFITSIDRTDREIEIIRAAIRDALADHEIAAAREALRLTGLSTEDEPDYASIAELGAKIALPIARRTDGNRVDSATSARIPFR